MLNEVNLINQEYVIGIDIGGTNTVFGIVDRNGKILAKDSIKTLCHDNFDDFLKELHQNVENLIERNNVKGKIKSIGIGAPSANGHTGEIINPANLPWGKVIPIAKKTSEIFGGLPVTVTNDANAAALGEMRYGAARGIKDFIMLTLGTGVGSGIVVNGEVLYGHDGFAGELGHAVVMRPHGRNCSCGRKGCLETYCSASGLVRTAKEFIERNPDTALTSLSPDKLSSKDVYEAAKKGDKTAMEIFEFTGNLLGEALADFVTFSSPKAIIIFGGLAKSGEFLMKPLRNSFEKSLLFLYGKPEIKLSELDENDAAILGASALGWEKD